MRLLTIITCPMELDETRLSCTRNIDLNCAQNSARGKGAGGVKVVWGRGP